MQAVGPCHPSAPDAEIPDGIAGPGASSHHKWFVSETTADNHQGHGHQSDVLDLKKPAAVQCHLLVVSDHGP